ncbi:MAG TPA: hypothetical protein VEI96_09600 [Thermodesulfovibrionales bacterium]|nr:hypothetical protein [Thermodesulfovibrionales bacterium]
MKKIMVLLLVCFLCFVLPVSAVASSGADKDGAVIADAIIVRPIGLASIVVGAAAFVLTLPFAVFSGSVKQTADTLVAAPCRFTFTRTLGDFESGSY